MNLSEKQKHARTLRDQGMSRALNHVEEVIPKWGDLALAYLHKFARDHEYFTGEDVTEESLTWGLVQPETLKAWGPVFVRAAKLGMIERRGTGISRRRHASICPRWQSKVLRAIPMLTDVHSYPNLAA